MMTKFDEFGLPEPTKYPQMPKVIKMNERTKELAKKAGLLGRKFMFGQYYDDELTDEQKKFAELIIKETLQIARVGMEFGPSMDEAVYTYFGIEE
jgi:hypothetical protein